MDDPIFDPWCLDGDDDAGSRSLGSRWRSRPGSEARAPSSRAPQAQQEGERLPGLPGYLRLMAVPVLGVLAGRLSAARHEVSVEDRLAFTPATVRFGLRAWDSPLSERAEPVDGSLELEALDATRGCVTSYVGSQGPPEQEVVAASKVGAEWIEARVLDLVSRVLAST